jgi:hypothetical protein
MEGINEERGRGQIRKKEEVKIWPTVR